MQTTMYIYTEYSIKNHRTVIGGAGVLQDALQGIHMIAAAPEMQRMGDDVSCGAAVHIGDSAANGLQRAVYGCKAIYRIVRKVGP